MVIKTIQLMLYREIITVFFQIHTKHINALCGQNVELLSVDAVGSFILKDYQLEYTLCKINGGGGGELTGIYLCKFYNKQAISLTLLHNVS